MRIGIAGCLLFCVLDVDIFFVFLLFLPFCDSLYFFDFDLDIVCFNLSFSCAYYAVSSVSVSAATRLAYGTWFDTYVRSFQPFYFCRRYMISLSRLLSCVFFFPPEVIFRSRVVIGACPATTDCIVAIRYVRTTTTGRGEGGGPKKTDPKEQKSGNPPTGRSRRSSPMNAHERRKSAIDNENKHHE